MPQEGTRPEILPFKREVAAVEGQTVAMAGHSPNSDRDRLPERLLGEVDVAQVWIEGVECQGLVDTGAMVTTVSQQFYQQNLRDIPLHPLNSLLKIECAGGDYLPYLGYIEADLAIDGDWADASECFPLLVVPDTAYSADVPILLGTNVLRPLMEKSKEVYGQRFLQKMATSTPWWLAFRRMSVQDRQESRQEGRVGLVKCAIVEKLRIPGNGRVTVPATVSDRISSTEPMVMFHPTEKTALPDQIEVTQTAMRCAGTDKAEVMVELCNLGTSPVTIQPRALLCELQSVKLADREEEAAKAEEDATQEKEVNHTRDEFLASFAEMTELSDDERTQVEDLLWEYRDTFSRDEFDIGHTPTIKHRIDLLDETPLKQRHRRIPPAMYEEVRSHLQQLKEGGIIQESSSPWSSPVVLVRKKNGKLRFCVDYRQLNQRTIKDSYALPRIDELMDHFGGCKYFSTLDMRSGFYQVEVEEQHKERTAFTVGPLGFWEFVRMPFGLSNSPATFQRLVEQSMGELHMRECFAFIDDIIVPGKDFEEELQRLRHVFEKLRQHKLKLNAEKCQFFSTRVKFCGHIISEEGIGTDPDKISKIADWPAPQSVQQLREFLGFCNYYRRFVKDFSKTAKPLNELLGGTPRRKTRKKDQVTVEWRWEEAQQAAFDTLKEHLTSPPVLGYARYDQPFRLYTDASGKGLGAVLSQQQDGQERVIAYASRGLSAAEQNYPAHKLEFLALKWAVTEKFMDYLYGVPHQFTVYTDNNPLTYVLTTAKLDATGHRWLAALAAFNFNILYRPGKTNVNADVLSRMDQEDYKVIDRDSISAICCGMHRKPASLIETCCMAAQVVDEETEPDVESTIGLKEVRRSQRDDPAIGPIIRAVNSNTRPRLDRLKPGTELHRLAREFDKLKMRRGLLYRVTDWEGQERSQVVLPKRYRELVLRSLHDDAGHQGRDKTLSLVRDRYYWPGMARDVDHKLKTCERCIKRKAPTDVRAPLVNIETSQPLELVCIDFLTLEPSKGGFQHLLVITDHFTRYAQAIPTKDQTAKTTAEALFNGFIVHYGIPLKLHSDQGANFDGKLIHELCNLTGMK